MLQALIEHDSNSRDRRYMDLAVENDEPVVVSMLRKLGFDYGMREIAIAGDLEQLKAAEALSPGSINQPVASYRACQSLLGIALLRGHQELADWLLSAGSSLDVRDEHQGNAMHLAALGKCDWIMARLRAAGCDPHAVNDRRETPLSISIAGAPPATVQAVIDAGADPTAAHTDQIAMWSQLSSRFNGDRRNPEATRIVAILLTAGSRPSPDDEFLSWVARHEPEIEQLLQQLRLELKSDEALEPMP